MRLIDDGIKRRSLTILYWKQGKKMLHVLQQPVIDIASEISPEELKERSKRLMNPEKVNEYISGLWSRTGAVFAVDMIRRVEKIAKKAEDGYDFWEDYFRRYTRERSMMIAREIVDGQVIAVNSTIDGLLQEGMERGIGIPEIQRAMRKDLLDAMTEINIYQAERIARTEVIGASNKGSFDGAVASGLDMKKVWMTSGKPGVRPTHQEYERKGPVDMQYSYAQGLKHPGDPDGDPEEIINCRCTIGYEVD
jgi:hypothetical protein